MKYILYLIIAVMPFYALSFDSVFPFNFERGEGPEYFYFNQGVDKAQSGDFESALQLFHKAIEINPFVEIFFISRGYVYIGLSIGKDDVNQADMLLERTFITEYLKKANEDFHTAIRLVSNSQLAHQGLGLALHLTGSHKESVKFSKKAIQLKPDSNNSYFILSMSLSVLGSHAESLDAINKAIELSPDSPDLYYNRVLIKARQAKSMRLIESMKVGDTEHVDKELTSMIKDLEKVIELQPDHEDAKDILEKIQQQENSEYTPGIFYLFRQLLEKLKGTLEPYIKSASRSRNHLARKCREVFLNR